MADRSLVFALDVPTGAEALALVDELAGDVSVFKIGLELFVAEGPSIVKAVRGRGVDVFLDLKLHDISNTVASAVKRVVDLDVRFLTVHATGGPKMLAAAQAATSKTMTLLAVTAAWVLFRSTGVDHAAGVYAAMLGFTGGTTVAADLWNPKLLVALPVGVLALAALLLAVSVQVVATTYSPFIYFKF